MPISMQVRPINPIPVAITLISYLPILTCPLLFYPASPFPTFIHIITHSYFSLSTPPCTMSFLSLTQYAHCCSRFIIEPAFLHHFPLPFVPFSHHLLAIYLVMYVESPACTTIYRTPSHLPCFIHQTQCHLARSSFTHLFHHPMNSFPWPSFKKFFFMAWGAYRETIRFIFRISFRFDGQVLMYGHRGCHWLLLVHVWMVAEFPSCHICKHIAQCSECLTVAI